MKIVTEREGWLDALGPLVIKELRQGLRARTFAIFFTIVLIGCLFVALMAGAEAAKAGGRVVGPSTLAVYLVLLSPVSFFVIPFTAFRSMSRELEDETWVLLSLTGIGGLSIIRGKWINAMWQAGLFASASAPFVLMTYYLNGVSVWQLAIAVILSALWTSWLTALAIALATQGRSRLGRTFVSLVTIGSLGGGTAMAAAYSFNFAQRFDRFSQDGGFGVMISIAMFSLAMTVLLVEAAASALALPTENASRRPRLALVGATLLAIVTGLGLYVAFDGGQTEGAAANIITCFFLTGCGAFVISERDGWPPSVTGGGLLRPGAVRGVALVFSLLIFSTAVWALAVVVRGNGYFGRHFDALLAAALYPLLYLSAGVILGRATPLARLGEPVASRVGFAIAAIGGSLVFGMLSVLVDGRPDGETIGFMGPVIGLAWFVDHGDTDGPLVVLGVLSVLMALIATGLLVSRDEARA